MSLRHTLLGLLDWVPSHGYALRELAKGYSWLHPMSNANIYPTLRQLESEGFVSCEEKVHDGRLRKIYSVTESGRSELRRWLADPTPQTGTYRDPVLLKICMLRDGSLDRARPWIEREMQEALRVVEDGSRFLKDQGHTLPRFTRRVVEHGIDLSRLRSSWLRSVLEEIEELCPEGEPDPGAPV